MAPFNADEAWNRMSSDWYLTTHKLQILCVLIAFTVMIYTICRLAYLLFLHPLAKYPGPFIARFTILRSLYQNWLRRGHLDLHELHEKYGTIVRYGPNLLSINNPYALQRIYGFKANTRKSDFYTVFPAVSGAVSTHTAIDPRIHARKRRVMSAALTDSALKSMESYVLEHITDYLKQLGEGLGWNGDDITGWRESVDVATLDSYLTFDIMGDLAYGKPFGVLGQYSENRRAIYLLSQASRLHNLDGILPFLKWSGLDRILFPKEYRHRQEFLRFSRSQVASRLAERVSNGKFVSDGDEDEQKDFFYYLSRSKDSETGEGLSSEELWGESNTIIIAGSDTTATSTTTTLAYLIHNPACLERLTHDIRSRFDKIDDIVHGPALNACTYLRACIDESMRMSPAVGIGLERVVGPGGLEVLPGQRVPEGTLVSSPIYALHHHKDFVQDPFTFDPDRWLRTQEEDHAKEIEIAKLRSVFNPFSIGPRSCIGKPMAYFEMCLVISRLLWQYDVRLPSGYNSSLGMGGKGHGQGRERTNEYQLWQDFVAECGGLKIDVKRRSY